MHQMVKLDSKILIGALYNSWPYDFVDLDKEALWQRAVEGMKQVGDEADKLGITIALEVLNRFETCLLTDCEEGVRFCRDVDRKSVKLLLDTFHMNIEEETCPTLSDVQETCLPMCMWERATESFPAWDICPGQKSARLSTKSAITAWW